MSHWRGDCRGGRFLIFPGESEPIVLLHMSFTKLLDFRCKVFNLNRVRSSGNHSPVNLIFKLAHISWPAIPNQGFQRVGGNSGDFFCNVQPHELIRLIVPHLYDFQLTYHTMQLFFLDLNQKKMHLPW